MNTILAHGIGGRLDLPIPLLYFILAAVTVLVLTFSMLAARWREPRLQAAGVTEIEVPRWWRWLGGSLSALSVLLLILFVLAGLFGSEDPLDNPAPVMLYIGLWLFFPFLSALVGDFYQVIAPWRVLSRWLGLGKEEKTAVAHKVGYWPAVGVLVAFSWWELVSPVGSVPVFLGWAAVVYAMCMFLSIGLVGYSSQLASWDGFGAYNHLMGAIGPLGLNPDGAMVRRGWLRGLPQVAELPGLDILAAVLIGGVTYDGLTGIPFWRNQLAGPLEDTLVGLGLDWSEAEVAVGTFGLLSVILFMWWAYHVACGISVLLGESKVSTARVRMRFAHSLVPIALAYAFAHYFTLVVYEGQFFLSAVSDPFDRGWDLFGMAERAVDYTLISPTAVWYIQLAAVIAGHVGGVVLAHDRALADFSGPNAVRSQYAMLGLMVILTMIALVILTSG
jgi:hypothetical protein